MKKLKSFVLLIFLSLCHLVNGQGEFKNEFKLSDLNWKASTGLHFKLNDSAVLAAYGEGFKVLSLHLNHNDSLVDKFILSGNFIGDGDQNYISSTLMPMPSNQASVILIRDEYVNVARDIEEVRLIHLVCKEGIIYKTQLLGD